MLDKLVPAREKYVLYRKAVWVYLFLLIFEGALRKWVLPALSTPLLLVRDPIVIWLVFVGMRKRWLSNGYAVAIMVVASVSFLLTMAVGHRNLYTALFGWRIYFFYFPFMFVIGKVLNRNDLLKMGRFILYFSIPMTVLVVVQFYSPQSAWVNRGVGGDTEGAGFAGALGYFRPPGTFSFTAGYVLFQLIVICFLAYYLMMNKSLRKSQQIKPWLLWIMAVCYLISIPVSISRTHFFQTVVVVSFLFLAAFLNSRFKRKVIPFLAVVILAGAAVLYTGIADESMAAFTARFESASIAEGGLTEGTIGNRYIGGLLSGLYNENIPILGYNIGLGTMAGSKLQGIGRDDIFYSEVEWGRVVGECGLLIGWIIIGMRTFVSLSALKKSGKQLRKRNDLLPWLLSAGMLLVIPQGQFGNVPNLGFSIFMGGIALSAITHFQNKYIIKAK
jgi:hypothetical protein